jgi:hypothetical protein
MLHIRVAHGRDAKVPDVTGGLDAARQELFGIAGAGL